MDAIQHLEQEIIQRAIQDLRFLIDKTKRTLAISVSSSQVLLYWQIGKRIHEEILKCNRANYGESIVIEISKQLTVQYGSGFSKGNVFRMMQFSNYFPDEQNICRLAEQLMWSHFVEIIALDTPLKRKFYAEMCKIEHWSVRALRKKIQGMLYERVGLSKKPDGLIEDELQALQERNKFSTDLVFQDPYLLDFLNLKDKYSEFDLESAIIHELEKFILEFGTDFCFIERQKRITVGDRDYYLDLLFFNRRLNRLIAIELKLGEFLPSHKGQMELYLRWVDKHERRPQEKKPLGIILCSRKTEDVIELLELGKTGIHVAEYLTELPPIKELEDRFHRAIIRAKEKISNQKPLIESHVTGDLTP